MSCQKCTSLDKKKLKRKKERKKKKQELGLLYLEKCKGDLEL